ncbi:MAG: bifunctional phosphoglucose/phosphomannose isomerase [Acidimicrobiia bacterium]
MIETLPGQYRWAAELAQAEVPAARSALICGMGGSGISGDVAAAVATGPVFVHKDFGLPPWAPSLPESIVVAVSYSGNTEETLSAVESARAAGLPVAAVSSGGRLSQLATDGGWPLIRVPGGLQPRAAFGYLAGAVVRLIEGAGLAHDVGLDEAASITATLLGDGLRGPGRRLADDLAEELAGRIAVIMGSGLTAVAAYRWKTQINENAKSPAFVSLLPEADHNEVEGWTTLGTALRRTVGVVMLRDDSEPESVGARFRPTSRLLGEGATIVGEVWAQGTSRLARLASLAAIGDLVSLRLARIAGVDPVAVDAIQQLKQTLGES